MSRKPWVIGSLVVGGLAVAFGSGFAVGRLGQTTRTAAVATTPPAAAAVSPAVTPPGSPLAGSPSPLAPATSPGHPSPSPSAVPTIRGSGAPAVVNGLAYDAATGQLIAFGSAVTQAGLWPLPVTWIWDGRSWGQAQTTGRTPSARTGASMAYDPVHRVVVMHGGYDEHTNWVNDTWAWNGAQWLQLSPVNSPPADGYVREQPLCWDPSKGNVVMVNEQGNAAGSQNPSQTWSWDGSTWTQLPAPGAPPLGIGSLQSMATAYDSTRHVLVMFAQVGGVPTTWTYDGASWTRVATSGTQGMNFAISADDTRSNLVMFGSAGDTWTWDGSRWTVQNPAHSPTPGGIYAMAYDPSRHLVVLLATLPSGDQTWTWDGSDWTLAG